MGRFLIVAGLLLVLAGVALTFFPRLFSWFGNLPGDLNIQRENSRIFIPITSMIVVSAGLTVLLNLLAWLERALR